MKRKRPISVKKNRYAGSPSVSAFGCFAPVEWRVFGVNHQRGCLWEKYANSSSGALAMGVAICSGEVCSSLHVTSLLRAHPESIAISVLCTESSFCTGSPFRNVRIVRKPSSVYT
jgi:hypothetical protein